MRPTIIVKDWILVKVQDPEFGGFKEFIQATVIQDQLGRWEAGNWCFTSLIQQKVGDFDNTTTGEHSVLTRSGNIYELHGPGRIAQVHVRVAMLMKQGLTLEDAESFAKSEIAAKLESDHYAAKIFRHVSEKWGLSDNDIIKIVGKKDYETIKQKDPSPLGEKTLEKIAMVFSIYKSLHTIFVDEQQADAWISKANQAFSGRSAIDFIVNTAEGLEIVQRYLQSQILN